jgi:hypothetical protein
MRSSWSSNQNAVTVVDLVASGHGSVVTLGYAQTQRGPAVPEFEPRTCCLRSRSAQASPWQTFELSDPRVVTVAEDVALITYSARGSIEREPVLGGHDVSISKGGEPLATCSAPTESMSARMIALMSEPYGTALSDGRTCTPHSHINWRP